jgi:hypothetical protein
MLRHINAGNIGALRVACSDLISDNSGSNSPSGTPIKSLTYGELAALEAVFLCCMCCKRFRCNYNDFHLMSANPRNTSRDMELPTQQPPDPEIVEQIVTALRRPLRHSGAEDEVVTAIGTIRWCSSVPFPNAARVRKAAKNLREKMGPLADGVQIPLEHVTGSSRCNLARHLAATLADALIYRFSPTLPSGTPDGQLYEIASLLYEAAGGGKDVSLKREIDLVRKGWRGLEHARGR